MQDALDKEIAQLGHQNVSLRKVAERHWQRSYMVVMAMTDCHCVNLLLLNELERWQRLPTLSLRMDTSVHQQPMPFHLEEPRGCANVAIGIQVRYPHVRWGISIPSGGRGEQPFFYNIKTELGNLLLRVPEPRR